MPIRVLRLIIVGAVLFGALTGSAAFGMGDDSDGANADGLDPIRNAIGKGEYAEAISKLEAKDEEDPQNADVLNLLGYSHRKLGEVDQAFQYYEAALKVKPQHRGANEYLGELYLETDQLDKAEERLAVLDKECFLPCEEYSELKAAIADYKKQHGID